MERRLLAKFGKKEHLNQLQNEGRFYCKDIKYFVQLEDGRTRGDEFEAVIELKYLEKGILELKPANDEKAEWKKLEIKNALIKKHAVEPLGNLYCMSALKVDVAKDPASYDIDSRFKSFGSHFLLITNQVLFFERIYSALKKLDIKYEEGLVEYSDLKKYSGEKNLFQKDLIYGWQEEFRIYFDTGNSIPLEFSIGSINDISEIYDLDKISKFLVKTK